MSWLTFRFIVLITFFWMLSVVGLSQEQKYPVVTHAGIQYAGAIGFINLQAGHSFFKSQSGDLDLMLGYVPKLVSEVDFWSLTLKYSHSFKQIHFKVKQLNIYPVGGGLYLSQGLGRNYFKYFNFDNYELGYYWVANTPRIGVFYSASVNLKLKNSSIITLYYELGTYDLRLYSMRNAGEATKFWTVFNSCFGLKYRFNTNR